METRWIRLYNDVPQGGYKLALSVYSQPGPVFAGVSDAKGSFLSGRWAFVGRPVVPLSFPEPVDAKPVNALLGDGIRLTHIKLEPPLEALSPGGMLKVALYWEAVTQPSGDYTLFVHLMDNNGSMVAQQDSAPLDGQYPTGNWGIGERVVTTHTLFVPDGIAGPFEVLVGMYSWPSVQRLPVIQDGVPAADQVVRLP